MSNLNHIVDTKPLREGSLYILRGQFQESSCSDNRLIKGQVMSRPVNKSQRYAVGGGLGKLYLPEGERLSFGELIRRDGFLLHLCQIMFDDGSRFRHIVRVAGIPDFIKGSRFAHIE